MLHLLSFSSIYFSLNNNEREENPLGESLIQWRNLRKSKGEGWGEERNTKCWGSQGWDIWCTIRTVSGIKGAFPISLSLIQGPFASNSSFPLQQISRLNSSAPGVLKVIKQLRGLISLIPPPPSTFKLWFSLRWNNVANKVSRFKG